MRAPELDGVILGAVLAVGDDWSKARSMVEASGHHEHDFLEPRAREVWGQIERLTQRRRPVDAHSLFSACRTAGKLRDEDLDWLIGLQAANTLAPASFYEVAENHLRGVRGGRIAAHLEKIAGSIRASGLQPAPLSTALEQIMRSVARDYVPDRTAAGDVAELIQEWDARLRGEKVGAPLFSPTGLKILDQLLRGWAPSLNLLLGDPGVGKSGVAASCIEASVGAGKHVGGFFLEEGSRFLSRRLLAKGLKITVGDVGFAQRTTEQSERLAELGQSLTTALGRLQIYTYEDLDIDELVRRARHWIHDLNVEEVWIDHLGEIGHRMPSARMHYKHNEAVAHSCKRLRDLGKATGVPIILLCHRTSDRQVRSRRGPPQASDVGLTGEAEKMARRIVGLWLRDQALRFTVLKNNDGQTGITGEFERLFDAALVDLDGGRVVNVEQERREDAEANEENKEDRRAARAAKRAAKAKALKEAEERKTAEVKKQAEPQLELLGGKS